ncbi:MAG: DNA primase [Phycisphaerae bacterium]
MKEKVLESVDIVDVVGERVSLTRKGREYVGLCPFHDDHRPSLSVSPQKQIFKCWSCGAGGDVIKFVQRLQRVEFREALGILARRAGIELRGASADDRSAAARERIRQALVWARSHFQRNLRETAKGERAAAYARSRGMTEATIDRFGLGYAADAWDDLLSHAARAGISRDVLQQAGLITTNEQGKAYDRFRHRLIFPICDTLGRCVAFGGRALGDDPAKYLNSPETPLFSKSRVLYGFDAARPAIVAAREAVVVEGYTDAVLLSQAGVANVVATLGTALSDAHVKLLSSLSGRIVMCFDSDQAGLRAADRAVETALRHRVEVLVAVMPDGQDPADFVIGQGVGAFKSLLQSAIGALEFNWNRTVQAYSEGGQQGQRDAVEAFLRFVARVTLAGGIDPLEQGLLVGRLGELLSLPAGTAYELLAKAKAAAAREPTPQTSTTSVQSAYDGSIRGLPVGLVSAIEELFGLALSAPEYFEELKEGLAAGVRPCDAWKRLYEILQGMAEERGSFIRSDVIQSCHDSALCELVSRATERVASRPVSPAACRTVSDRVLAELEAVRQATLRANLREKSAEEGAADYEALLAIAKRQRGRDAKPPILCAE